MAKNKKSRKRNQPGQGSVGSAVGVAGEEPTDERSAASRGRDESGLPPGDDGNGSGDGGPPPSPGAGGPRGPGGGGGQRRLAGGPGFFTVYKTGQGYYTRLGTALGGGLILVFGANYIYMQLAGVDNPAVQLGVPSIFLALSAVVLFWITGSNRGTNDFFIATEGEMKKVSWSTQKEVVGSTKVVLGFTLLMASFLFVVDILFLLLFSSIDVLQMDISTLLGLDS